MIFCGLFVLDCMVLEDWNGWMNEWSEHDLHGVAALGTNNSSMVVWVSGKLFLSVR